MKKISLILILIFTVNLYKSQTLNFTPNATNINNNINKFIGSWIWTNGSESLQLIFKKENILLPVEGNVRADLLFGYHKYVKNNLIVENSTQFSSANYTDKKSTLLGNTYDNPNKISGSIEHTTKNKSVNYEIDYIDATHIKLVSLKNYEGIRITVAGQPPYDSSITLPQNIILTKQ